MGVSPGPGRKGLGDDDDDENDKIIFNKNGDDDGSGGMLVLFVMESSLSPTPMSLKTQYCVAQGCPSERL